MGTTWNEHITQLAMVARDNLRVARNGREWAVISLTRFWEDEDDTPELMDCGFTSPQAAEMRIEAYVDNFCDMESRINRAAPAPHDRGSSLEHWHFNDMADEQAERDRRLAVLRDAGVENPDAVLEAIIPKPSELLF